jgi:hypothetical protein
VGVLTSILTGATGAFLRFELAAEAAGFKMHAAGVVLMISALFGVVLSLMHWSTWGGFNRRHTFGSGDTVLIDPVTFPRTFKVERLMMRRRRL